MIQCTVLILQRYYVLSAIVYRSKHLLWHLAKFLSLDPVNWKQIFSSKSIWTKNCLWCHRLCSFSKAKDEWKFACLKLAWEFGTSCLHSPLVSSKQKVNNSWDWPCLFKNFINYAETLTITIPILSFSSSLHVVSKSYWPHYGCFWKFEIHYKIKIFHKFLTVQNFQCIYQSKLHFQIPTNFHQWVKHWDFQIFCCPLQHPESSFHVRSCDK